MKTLLKLSISLFISIFFICCTSKTSSLDLGDDDKPILPEGTVTLEYDCLPKTSANKLEILTWNLEHFPKDDDITIESVAEVIKKMDVDVIALQEISNKESLDKLTDYLPGYESAIMQRSSINLAYIYKTSEISLNGGNSYGILKDKGREFSMRTPFVLPIHSNSTGLDILLVNVHLKAFGGAKNIAKRQNACFLIKNWIDNNHPNDNVIVLGDMNDEITDSKSENVFQIFINDKENYHFADRFIAQKKNKKEWSYPSFPSHIDHILITNELFDNEDTVYTYKLKKCIENYDENISDHQPVCLVLKK